MIEQYITSFIEGRVRLRHPALKNIGDSKNIQDFLSNMEGIDSAEINTQTGSLLLCYDINVYSSLDLLEMAQKMLPEELLQVEKGKLEHISKIAYDANLKKRLVKMSNLNNLNNYAMVVSIGVSVISLAFRVSRVHSIAGAAFILLSTCHMYKHRRSLCSQF